MNELQAKIIALLNKNRLSLTPNQLCERLGFDRSQAPLIKKTLEQMAKTGSLTRSRTGKFSHSVSSGLLEGKIQSTVHGGDFFISDAGGDDLRVVDTHYVMNRDRVLVRPFPNRTCKIIKILSHGYKTVVGTVVRRNSRTFLVPDDNKLHTVIVIPRGKTMNAPDGYKVNAEITAYPTAKTDCVAVVTEILGDPLDRSTAVISIIKSYNVKEVFDQGVLHSAELLEPLSKKDYTNRLDCRKWTIITIDGEDAKDLDDAVSLEILDNGNYKLGVHIADVSNYVRNGSIIDNEAAERGTSVYIPGTVFPMLPTRLSNGLCSLNPHEDRLTLSVIMEINKNGQVIKHKIAPSVICSAERMCYGEVSEMLENSHSPLRKKYKNVLGMLILMEQLMRLLRTNRNKRGSIDFDLPESKIILDETGKPINIEPYQIGVSNKIIEEFMLICNETVAKHMRDEALPAVYRIHKQPDATKTEGYRQFLRSFGYSLPDEPKPTDFQQLLKQFDGKPEQPLLQKLMLRAMSKARYSTVCEGHFGLAAENYLHFTSPIRRYPDLIVHRILHWSFENNHEAITEYSKKLDTLAISCSECEVNAENAERAVEDLEKAEFMQDKIGEVYDGIISGVTAYGIYVELANTVEGFIHISEIGGDYFEFDEERYSIIGKRTRRMYRLGSSLCVKVFNVNIAERKVEFSIVNA